MSTTTVAAGAAVVLPHRPAYSKAGREAKVSVNAYQVTKFPSLKVHQYDCQIGADGSKRALIKKLWTHPKLQNAFGPAKYKVIFDGVRLAWSSVPLPFGEDLNMIIDLDEGKPQRPGAPARENKHRIVIRKTSVVPLQVLQAYIQGQCDWDTDVLVGINFFDHLLRETPSKTYLAIKRSFFARNGCRQLPGGVEAWKGIFQSIRPADGGKLIVNVDTSTAVFWESGPLHIVAQRMSKTNDLVAFENLFAAGDGGRRMAAQLRRLKRVQFTCHHRKRDNDPANLKVYTIEGFVGSAKDTTFEMRKTNRDGTENEVQISVADYYVQAYNIRLKHPRLPLVRTRKPGEYYPMELCHVIEGQRCPFKLDDRQTADMIKFTVERPDKRVAAIRQNVHSLGWDKDPVLDEYGMQISSQMLTTKARLLPAPKIEYGRGSKQAVMSAPNGQWDLRDKKFVDCPKTPLKSWGIMVFNSPRTITEQQIKQFVQTFIQVYSNHGGQVTNKQPAIMYADSQKPVGVNIFSIFRETGTRNNMKPQLLMCILPGKSQQPYADIKAYCDINLGVASQCLQTMHVLQSKPQYCSNVCMKVNAKLGGSSNRLHTDSLIISPENPTFILGADVSHSAPGSHSTSYASMVGSTNLYGTRFAAVANTNGQRVEIINTRNMVSFVITLMRGFRISTGVKPRQIVYFRDGVSEGEYDKIVSEEIRDIRQACDQLESGYRPKITAIVCSKRHHFRFFPVDNFAHDQNRNPVPGVLIDRDITHPRQYDFYLNSHKALQGTCRPVHYHVVHDEIQWPVERLQSLIYNSCFTFVRSTTSVSLVPATYYAHIASARARFHEPVQEDANTVPSSTQSPQSGEDVPEKKLRALHEGLRTAMWFV
ncbi:Piwi-domain-containing protein [Ascodesmis nigricans]|uniref:Piwi-domain-containing protein n=1 Tax=Ascodesmis nigricans TaxID=341454 RepID=A0A4S2MWZ7_9PEZI|nr:Piwi-domain-containing protein [Ascodesmis nigricans]